jgi:hypothetical protein
MAVNMPTGERYAYAKCLMHALAAVHCVWPYMLMYDINCRFGPHLGEMAAQSGASGLWDPLTAAWVGGMQKIVGPFHLPMHTPDCQARNSILVVPGGGMGPGEPNEVFNKVVGTAGPVLQYAAKPVRNLWLEVQILAWQRQKLLDLPDLLQRMLVKAVGRKQEVLAEQRQFKDLALSKGAAPAQVCNKLALKGCICTTC